ncbi:MAG: alkaline phosphatase [Akkermansia sp.]|nr:alkaline phosphatase [Akkermansia sp.]
MGAEHLWAAWLCNRGKLNITQLPCTAFSCTVSANQTITDSAAGGTALACGVKTNNAMLGQTPDGAACESLAEYFRHRGMATGLVVTADHQTGGLAILDGSAERGQVRAVFTTGKHSGVAVPVYAAGAGAGRFHGVIQNTQVAHLIKKSVASEAGDVLENR